MGFGMGVLVLVSVLLALIGTMVSMGSYSHRLFPRIRVRWNQNARGKIEALFGIVGELFKSYVLVRFVTIVLMLVCFFLSTIAVTPQHGLMWALAAGLISSIGFVAAVIPYPIGAGLLEAMIGVPMVLSRVFPGIDSPSEREESRLRKMFQSAQDSVYKVEYAINGLALVFLFFVSCLGHGVGGAAAAFTALFASIVLALSMHFVEDHALKQRALKAVPVIVMILLVSTLISIAVSITFFNGDGAMIRKTVGMAFMEKTRDMGAHNEFVLALSVLFFGGLSAVFAALVTRKWHVVIVAGLCILMLGAVMPWAKKRFPATGNGVYNIPLTDAERDYYRESGHRVSPEVPGARVRLANDRPMREVERTDQRPSASSYDYSTTEGRRAARDSLLNK